MGAYYPDTMQNILCTLADPVPDMITLSVTTQGKKWLIWVGVKALACSIPSCPDRRDLG